MPVIDKDQAECPSFRDHPIQERGSVAGMEVDEGAGRMPLQ